MSEIEKIKRYIERTKVSNADSYKMNVCEVFELARQAKCGVNEAFSVIETAFNYGKAKGYRAAKAERRAARG